MIAVVRAPRLLLLGGILAAVGTPARAEALAAPSSEETRVADIVQAALAAHGSEVNRCFEKALADTMDVEGKVELSVDVGEGGRVTNASPAVDDVKSPVLLACLEESAATWTLAGIEAGSSVILPLAFQGQAAQFSIKMRDAPIHGPPAPKARPGARPRQAPFSVRLLVDGATMHARQASLSELTLAPANRIAMHKHPGSEALYLLRGHARVLGPPGVPPQKLEQGMAIFIPAGMPHVIENMGRSAQAVMLEVFAPLGPERVYRDPRDETGRAAFQVIHGAPKRQPGAHFTVAGPASAVPPVSVFGGKAKSHALLDRANTGSADLYLGVLDAESGAVVPRNTHEGSAEILFVLSGGGELTVGSEKIPFSAEEALHIPEDQPHGAKFREKTLMLQIFAPAGPEARYRAGGEPAQRRKPSADND